MDIKHILEKLSELDAKQTLLESAPTANVLVESTVAEPKRTSIYDVLVSELMAEADYTLPKGKFPNAVTQGNAPAAEPGAGIANPPPNLNVAAPTTTNDSTLKVYNNKDGGATFTEPNKAAAAPAALTPTPNITQQAPAADAKPGFADRVKAGFQKIGDFHQQNSDRLAAQQAADAAANSPEGLAAAKAKLTPSQLKWLGNATPSPEILNRMPKPLPGETTPAAPAAEPAAATTSPVAQPTVTSVQSSEIPSGPQTVAGQEGDKSKDPATNSDTATSVPTGGLENPANQTAAPAAPATAAADPTAPAVTANPTATPAKAPYKGSTGAQEIQKLNPEVKDVNKIYPGQSLKMPDGSTYTVKPGDTLDRIAKGVKPAAPADNKAKVPPAANPAPNQLGKPPVAGQKEAPAPFRKELDVDRIKQLSGAPAKPGKVDLSVNNPAMNPVNNTQPTAKESMERILSIIGSK